jgi:hypothetical protein
MPIYNSKYVVETTKEFTKYIKEKDSFSQFEFEIPNGFALVPVMEICRSISEYDNLKYQEDITRYCIIGKQIKVKLDGKEVGNFIMNRLDDKWESYEVFMKYPLALFNLKEICMAYITKKLLPPQRNTLTPTPAGAMQA